MLAGWVQRPCCPDTGTPDTEPPPLGEPEQQGGARPLGPLHPLLSSLLPEGTHHSRIRGKEPPSSQSSHHRWPHPGPLYTDFLENGVSHVGTFLG